MRPVTGFRFCQPADHVVFLFRVQSSLLKVISQPSNRAITCVGFGDVGDMPLLHLVVLGLGGRYLQVSEDFKYLLAIHL